MGWFGDVERGLGVGLEPCETLLLILKLAAGGVLRDALRSIRRVGRRCAEG